MIIRPPPKLTNQKELVFHVEVKIWSWLKELTTALLKLNFSDNFQSFQVTDVTIPANTEVNISNQFFTISNGVIPSKRIIVRQRGDAVIQDGDTVWDAKSVYLKNASANDAVITVVFFK